MALRSATVFTMITSWVCVLSPSNSSDKLGFILNTGECCLYTFYLHISEKTLIPSKVTRMTLDTTLYGYTIDLVITNEHGDLLSLETRHVCSSSTLHGKQEGLVLKVLLSYITNLRPPWVTWDPDSKNYKKSKIFKFLTVAVQSMMDCVCTSFRVYIHCRLQEVAPKSASSFTKPPGSLPSCCLRSPSQHMGKGLYLQCE